MASLILGQGVIAQESQNGDIPLPRFGHTMTFMGNFTAIMFGGAVGDSGRYTITNDVFTLNLNSLEWLRLAADSTPSPRAAHAAACVDSMQFVIYGGATGGGSLSTDEEPPLNWMSVPITGITPGRRYGHSMVYHKLSDGHQKASLVVFGGNDGSQVLGDIWYMDVQKSPFIWNKIAFNSNVKQPLPRVYHAAVICRDGPASNMMVVFGGRTTNNQSLRDTWGLRQHRDGRWDWIGAPIKKGTPPEPRFQHTSVFIGSKMLIIGGRSTDVAKTLPTSLYDTEICEWRTLPSINRFRHAAWECNNVVYAFGGFDHRSQSHPTGDIQLLDVQLHPGFFSEKERLDLQMKRTPTTNAVTNNFNNMSNTSFQEISPNISIPFQQKKDTHSSDIGLTNNQTTSIPFPFNHSNDNIFQSLKANVSSQLSSGKPIVVEAPNINLAHPWISYLNTPTNVSTLTVNDFTTLAPIKETQVRLSTHVHTKVDSPHNPDFSVLVRKVSIDRLEDEGRKLRGGHSPIQYQLNKITELNDNLPDRIIRKLLKPNITPLHMDKDFNPSGPFCLPWEDVSQLCSYTLMLVRQEPMILRLRAPIKVYGDIHGQYYDLMRLFGSYKSPVEEDWKDENMTPCDMDIDITGDIDTVDYLFLGDFVDRGTHSLEVISLLFALKCRYPNQIHLIRGNHEDKAINGTYGFQDECRRRLCEDPSHRNSCWEQFNTVFDHLPVAALIEHRILCIHGGLGRSINTLEDINSLKRPLSVAQLPTNEIEQRVTDLLWSDPTDNDSITGVVPNLTRDQDRTGKVFKFGPDRVQNFLIANNLCLIIRAHECVMDGFERFAGGKLITVFSATDYCGHHNAGALLFIRRDLTVIPKIIYPFDGENLRDTWLAIDSRPPTPPRSIRKEKDYDLDF